jgi:thiosulfate dehydrogenase
MAINKLNETGKAIVVVSRTAAILAIFFIVIAGILISIFLIPIDHHSKSTLVNERKLSTNVASKSAKEIPKSNAWQAPEESSIPTGKPGEQIRYGKELIAHTSLYFGPQGKVARITNGMNCQNCHLAAGTKPWGNNFSAVNSTYPKFRVRSGTKETVVKRINDCFERSLNGKAIDSNSSEMQAMIAYIKWLGTGVQKGKSPVGAGLEKLTFLKRSADPTKGALIYNEKCTACHGASGEGIQNMEKTAYIYPPLWGEHSYNDGAGLYRLSTFAGYVKNNMPLGATKENPQLTDEEVWDLAAFVNAQARPHKDQRDDYKNLAQKPIDFPFGPYADQFSESQHKFGPFEPIVSAMQAQNKTNQ